MRPFCYDYPSKDEPEVRLLTALGSQIGMALHNARLHAGLKPRLALAA
jgi:hypothetical protein